MKAPRTLSSTDYHRRSTGGSVRPDQLPSHRPFDLDKFNLEPEPFLKKEYDLKTSLMERSDVTTKDVSSAYCEITGKGLFQEVEAQ